MENISTIAGWIGMVLILVAYYLVSVKKVSGQAYIYISIIKLFRSARNYLEYLCSARMASNDTECCLGDNRSNNNSIDQEKLDDCE